MLLFRVLYLPSHPDLFTGISVMAYIQVEIYSLIQSFEKDVVIQNTKDLEKLNTLSVVKCLDSSPIIDIKIDNETAYYSNNSPLKLSKNTSNKSIGYKTSQDKIQINSLYKNSKLNSDLNYD